MPQQQKAPDIVVVTDANVLINLIHADLLALLADLPPYRFVISEHVLVEITRFLDTGFRRCDELFVSKLLCPGSATRLLGREQDAVRLLPIACDLRLVDVVAELFDRRRP